MFSEELNNYHSTSSPKSRHAAPIRRKRVLMPMPAFRTGNPVGTDLSPINNTPLPDFTSWGANSMSPSPRSYHSLPGSLRNGRTSSASSGSSSGMQVSRQKSRSTEISYTTLASSLDQQVQNTSPIRSHVMQFSHSTDASIIWTPSTSQSESDSFSYVETPSSNGSLDFCAPNSPQQPFGEGAPSSIYSWNNNDVEWQSLSNSSFNFSPVIFDEPESIGTFQLPIPSNSNNDLCSCHGVARRPNLDFLMAYDLHNWCAWRPPQFDKCQQYNVLQKLLHAYEDIVKKMCARIDSLPESLARLLRDLSAHFSPGAALNAHQTLKMGQPILDNSEPFSYMCFIQAGLQLDTKMSNSGLPHGFHTNSLFLDCVSWLDSMGSTPITEALFVFMQLLWMPATVRESLPHGQNIFCPRTGYPPGKNFVPQVLAMVCQSHIDVLYHVDCRDLCTLQRSKQDNADDIIKTTWVAKMTNLYLNGFTRCPQCSKRFATTSKDGTEKRVIDLSGNISRHLKSACQVTKNDPNPQKFDCPDCRKWFSRADNLTAHRKIHTSKRAH